jgi:hypothetical protein
MTMISSDPSSIRSDITATITSLLPNLPNANVRPDGVVDCSAYIESLEPWGLAYVPGFRTLPRNRYSDDPIVEDPTWRADWFEWRDKAAEVRILVQRAMRDRPELRPAELALCANDPAYWLTMYGTIEEPRAIDGEDFFKDFQPFAYQVHLIQWFVRMCESPDISDGYISKARGLGATWIMCAGATWAWLFRPWRGILVSRKEDLVDKPLDLNSMFGKIDLLLDMMPSWMEPEGFNRTNHRLRMMLMHPTSRAQITGESTTGKAGRGARATYIIYDEAAFIANFQEVYATGAGTTKHRFGISSESFSEGYYWYDTWKAVAEIAPSSVQQLDFFHNRYFDHDWFEHELNRWLGHDPEGFKREYLRDPWAGFGQAVYPVADTLAETEDGYDPTVPLLVGIDPGMADDTAIVIAQMRGEGPARHLVYLDSYENNRLPAEWYAHIFTGMPPEFGDKCYGLPITPNDTRMFTFFRGVRPSMLQVACDPAGGQKDASGLSFVERIVLESLRLRKRQSDREVLHLQEKFMREGQDEASALGAAMIEVPKPKAVIPMYTELYRKNRHDQRRLALRTLLTNAKFYKSAGAGRIRLAMKHYRFSEPTDKSTSEPAPIHDQWSHLVTACEFMATFIGLNILGRDFFADKTIDADPHRTRNLERQNALRKKSTFGGKKH